MSVRGEFPVPSLANGSFVEILSHPDSASIITGEVVPNRLGDVAEQLNMEWVRRFLGSGERRLARTRSAQLAALTYRRAELQPLVLGADLIAWLFFFDDYHGEGWTAANPGELVRLFDALEVILAAGTLPSQPLPLHYALADLRARMLALGGAAWLDRFTVGMRKYFNGCLLEFPHRQARQSLSLRNYRVVRRWSVGLDPVMDMIEIAVGESLPAPPRPGLLELRDLCALLCAWVNDIYSFNKESGDHDPINLVAVLKHECDCSFGDALAAAMAEFHADLRRFLQAKRDFDVTATPLERQIARGLEDWITGNLTWSASTARYKPL